ncbi:MAG TPA: hypothetical protein VD862_00230, partial [Candidatus Paceibacterota bacterium]|nr:hypothetical protein [Candidatus Paceibacterota bacterium]
PEANDWVTFNVTLANPDGSTRECGLQSTAIRPYGSDCPTVGSTVDKIAPSTFRAVLYNVWVNSRPEDAKHIVTAGEKVGGNLPFLETGNNLEIARAYDEEVRIIGHCSNCVYEQVQGRFFRVR